MADDLVMEEREELMMSSSGGQVGLRRGHFLKPSVTFVDGPVAAPSLSCPATVPLVEYKDLPLMVNYHGWKLPPENWKTWVNQMHELHHTTWKNAGIVDAIMSSTCIIHRYDELIFGFVEKWCPTTNSFVFPWGEASITLEDMMVLGGYSVLGEWVWSLARDDELDQVVKKLQRARSNISKSKARKATQGRWITQFVGSGSEIEHEAFLAYWLSRFVFPFTRDTISRNVVAIAVYLARGTKIALAPAVLAAIYKSLTLLKAAVVAARKSGTKEDENCSVVRVTVSAPLAVVQVWIWERFPSLRPKAIGGNEPSLARWHNLKLYRSLTIDSTGKDFQWRPYTTTKRRKGMVYRDDEEWVKVGSDLDEDLMGFVRCLRTSELVNLLEPDCIEHYLPHRVAMQFGMDQDLPGHVARVNVNPEIAWLDYTRPIRDAKIYIPPRLSQPCVTARYSKWWKKLNLGWSGKCTTSEDSRLHVFARKLEDEYDDFIPPPPGFPPKRKRLEEAELFQNWQDVQRQSPLNSAQNTGGEYSSTGPRKLMASSSSSASDYNDTVNPPGFPPNQCQRQAAQGVNQLSSKVNNVDNPKETLLVEPVESEVKWKLSKEACIDTLDKKIVMSPSNEAQGSTSRPLGIELEEKMRSIEKLVAVLKAGELTCLG